MLRKLFQVNKWWLLDINNEFFEFGGSCGFRRFAVIVLGGRPAAVILAQGRELLAQISILGLHSDPRWILQ